MARYITTSEKLRAYPISVKAGKATAIYNQPGTSTGKVKDVKTGAPIGMTTGRIAVSTDNPSFLFWVELYALGSNYTKPIGWVWYTEYLLQPIPILSEIWKKQDKLIDQFYASNARAIKQDIADALVKNDVKVFMNLCYAAKLIQAADKKGVNVAAQKREFAALVTRYNERQKYLRDNTKSTIGAWDSLKKSFSSFVNWLGVSGLPEGKILPYCPSNNINGLGAIPLIAVAIVAAVVIGVTALVTTLLIQRHNEGAQDVDKSGALGKALEKLAPAEAAAVEADVKAQLVDAYDAGANNQRTTDKWDLTKYAGVAVAAILFFTVGIPALQNATQRRPAY